MIYVFPVTTPANIAASAQLKTLLALTRGHITGMQVYFPSGHLGLTHIQIARGLHQLFPTNPEADFSSSGEAIVWKEDVLLDTPPYQLECYAWNLDDTYTHTITVRVQVEALTVEKSLVEEIKSLLGLGQEAPSG